MSLPDLDALIAPLSPDAPCGPNLEYDPMFMELERAAAGRPERQFGNFIEPAQGPDWLRVQQLAGEIFQRTKDLRVAVAWTRALTATDGLAGAVAGLQLIAHLVTTWPTQVHPVVEPDEEHPTMRWNVVAALDAAPGFLGDLRALLPAGWVASVWPHMYSELMSIREALGSGSSGDALPQLQGFLDHEWTFDPDRPLEARDVELSGQLQEPWSAERQELLDRICGIIDRAGFDAAAMCRRADRISFTRFDDLASGVTPGRRRQLDAFFKSTSVDSNRSGR